MTKTSIFTVITHRELECKLCGKHIAITARASHGKKHVTNGEAEREIGPRRARYIAEIPANV